METNVIIGIILATFANFPLGMVWFSTFQNPWVKGSGLTMDQAKNVDMKKPMLIGLILNFIAAVSLAMFVGEDASIGFSTLAGFLAGSTWVATAMGVNYMYEQKSLTYFLISAGYAVLNLTVMGLIIGLCLNLL